MPKNNFAVLVGINKYKRPGNDLEGCLNDIYDSAKFILSKDWDQTKIVVLKDSMATKKAMVEALQWLIATGGKELLFHYSGHGSQVPYSGKDEPDHRREILCPYDCDDFWDDPLDDKTLKAIFAGKRAASNLTVILDCCHSGGGTRIIDPSLPTQHKPKSKFRLAPMEIDGDMRKAPLNRLAVKQRFDTREVVASMNHVLYAACRDNETAADSVIGGRPNGAWTWGIMRAAGKNIQNGIGNDDLFRNAKVNVKAAGYEQNPVLECGLHLRSRPFLGGI